MRQNRITRSGNLLIREKSDYIRKSGGTHSYGETWKQDEKKFEIQRSVEFTSEGEICRNKRRIRGCGPFGIWNLEFSRRVSDGETHCLSNSYGESNASSKADHTRKSKSWKEIMVTQSTRVSSHNSPFGSSLLDRQENRRTRTWWLYGWSGREYGYLGHISECHSSSSSASWTRLWGEFTIREESSLE